ncbi:endospore germination permease [Paenibacillus hodogayensis]|uniref:Endospore germination permease n=1 Tax=Paenibacillus hodogayensis TaxID=279208 RepID=A0ABV5VPI4_9BACL
MIKVSGYQLFAATVFFQLGTTVVFGFASDAGRDAWIAILLSASIGMLVILGYTVLANMMPGLTLVEWFPKQFGPWLGIPIAWLYPLLFIYDAARGISDLEGLVPVTLLPGTPTWVILGCMMLVIVYLLFSGVEVIFRLAGLLLPIILLSFLLELLLLLSSQSIILSNIFPILGEGWGRVWKSVWPFGILQTFGETIEFAMLWTFLKQDGKLTRINLIAVMVSGITITVFDMFAIMVLGESVFQRNVYPLLVLLKQLSISDFLDNLDALGVMHFMTTTLLKITLHLITAVLAIRKLTRSQGYRLPILIAAAVTLWTGSNMAQSVADHLFVGTRILPYNLWIPLFLVIPGILLTVAWIRKQQEPGYE